LRDIL